MSHRIRAFAGILTILLTAGCASTVSDQRLTRVPEPQAMVLVALAGHPPITASGVVATFDPATDVLRFDDGRMVKLTGRSKVLHSVGNAIRAGDFVVLQNVLPIGVQSGVKTLAVGQPQRMGTIAAVDESRGVVEMTDGTVVQVTRATNVHLGAAGSNLTLTQLSPGDELIVVFGEGGSGAPAPADDATVSVSALPRQDIAAGVEAGEVMIFRVPRRP